MPRKSALAAVVIVLALVLLPVSGADASRARGSARVRPTLANVPAYASYRQPMRFSGTGSPRSMVYLQAYATNGTWVTEWRSHTDARGHYSIKAPTWWVHSGAWRVKVGGRVSGWHELTVTDPAARRPGTAWAGIDRVRWNPCNGVIRWKLNPSNGLDGQLSTIKAAFRKLTSLTGLRFAYAGTTTTPINTNTAVGPYDGYQILIGWSDPSYDANMTGGGSDTWATTTPRWYASNEQMQSAVVALNMDYRSQMIAGMAPGGSFGMLMLHELGHVVGLDHVDDQNQAMYPTIIQGARTPDYGQGDKDGLWSVGAAQGCI